MPSFHENMDLAEGLIKRIFNDVLQESSEDMQFFNDRIDDTVIATLEKIGSSQFARIGLYRSNRFVEACAKMKFDFEPAWGQDLQSEHERYLTEEAIGQTGDRDRLSEYDQTVLYATE